VVWAGSPGSGAGGHVFEDLWQYYAVAGLAVNELWLKQWKRREG
jgi:hypothetical protein